MKTSIHTLQLYFSLFLLFFLVIPVEGVAKKVTFSVILFFIYVASVHFSPRLWTNRPGVYYKLFIYFLFFLYAACLFIIYYPGGMISDSHYLFSMAYVDEFKTYRSRFLALVYQFLFLFNKSTVPILIIQVVVYSSAIFLLVNNLFKRKAFISAVLIFFISSLPFFNGLIGILCEHAWIANCYILGIILLYVKISEYQIKLFHFISIFLIFLLGFYTRTYDIFYGLPLFFVFFLLFLKDKRVGNSYLVSCVLVLLIFFSHFLVTNFIDSVKETKSSDKTVILLNYYRALPVPYDPNIELPSDVRDMIVNRLQHKSRGWEVIHDLSMYSILEKDKIITREEIVPEIIEYIKRNPMIFLKGYFARFTHLLTIPPQSNWIIWTRYNPGHRLNKLNYSKEFDSFLESKYVAFSNYYKQNAYISQPSSIFLLSLSTFMLAIRYFSRSNLSSYVLLGWAASGFIQVVVNLLLALHGAYRLYYWSVISSILIILVIHATSQQRVQGDFESVD